MVGSIHGKEARSELRRQFSEKGVKLLLSDWEMQQEDLPAGQTLDEDEIYSDDASDEDCCGAVSGERC